MKLISTAIAIVVIAGPAHAANLDFTEQMATIIASERLCGLSYDAAAVKSYIEGNVAADDLAFADDLSDQVNLREVLDRDISGSKKVARCSQVERVARSFKFID